MSWARGAVFVAAFLPGLTGAAVAQVQVRRAQASAPESSGAVFARPRLGLTVDIRPHATDTVGALVETVQPGSPAEKAGIRPADIITRLNGQPVASPAGTSAGLHLISLAARLEPNTPVPVELRRDGRRHTVMLVTAADMSFSFNSRLVDSGVVWSFNVEAEDSDASRPKQLLNWFTSPIAALETAMLNPQLGQYFGISDGILVIHAAADNRLPLQGGDVILTVVGQKPTDPGHLMRLLKARTGPTQIVIVRHRQRLTITFQPQ